jgi:hypothetical protein
MNSEVEAAHARVSGADIGVQLMQQHFAQLRIEHPEWFADFEDADPIIAPKSVLEDLLRTAPTEFAQAYLLGIYNFRLQLSVLTGTEF